MQRPTGQRPTGPRLVSPRSCTSSRTGVNRGGVTLAGVTGGWAATPLEPFANARLLLNENARPVDITSPVIATHVIEYYSKTKYYRGRNW